MSEYRSYLDVESLVQKAVDTVGQDTLEERIIKYGMDDPFRNGISYNHLGSFHFVDQRGRQYTPVEVNDANKADFFFVRLPKGITRKQNQQLSEAQPLYLEDMLDFPHEGEEIELSIKDVDHTDVLYTTRVASVFDMKRATAKVMFYDELLIDRSLKETRKRDKKTSSAAKSRDRERDRARGGK